MAGKIDTALKLSVIASLLIAASGVAYYYALYLPDRDARLERERASEQLLEYGEKRAEAERAAVEQRQLAEQRAAEKAAVGVRYRNCLDEARARHEAAWAAACKRLAAQAAQDHANCLATSNLSQVYCDAAYRARDGSTDCTLPVEVATDIDGDLTADRNRCLRQRDATLQ